MNPNGRRYEVRNQPEPQRIARVSAKVTIDLPRYLGARVISLPSRYAGRTIDSLVLEAPTTDDLICVLETALVALRGQR